MAYIVKSSEKTKGAGAEGETKALLYLMNFRDDSEEIYYYVIDFFNDVTGMNNQCDKLWDVQSKYTEVKTAKVIGKELVTLFKNFVSDIDFTYYILFIKKLTAKVRKDDSLNIFDINNINEESLDKIKEGLIAECDVKKYIDEQAKTKINIDNFLKKVLFVVDDKETYEYVQKIVENKPLLCKDKNLMTKIFNEIRDKQSSKKNTNVEGTIINIPSDSLKYVRHISKKEIKYLVIQRIISNDPLNKSVPTSFIPILNTFPEIEHTGILQDCRLSLSVVLFNNNLSESFWSLFEKIYELIEIEKNQDVNMILDKIDKNLIDSNPNFNILSLKYFIARVKDGLENDY